MQEFVQALQQLKDGCQAVFGEIRERASLLPEEIALICKDEVVLEPPPLGDYGEAYALRIRPDGLFWERRQGRMVTTTYVWNAGRAEPQLASEILESWLEYWRKLQSQLTEAKARISLRNRQIRDLRRQLRR
jgi:hypothetical protein